jgi:hypothetical protein
VGAGEQRFSAGGGFRRALILLLRELRRFCAPQREGGLRHRFSRGNVRKPWYWGSEQAVFPKSFATATVACLWTAPSFLLGFPEPSCACSETRRCAEPWVLTEEQSSRATFRSPAFATGWNRFSAALANALL